MFYIFNKNHAWASRDIDFDHTHTSTKTFIYETIRKIVMRIIMVPGEDNKPASETALILGLISVSFTALLCK